MLSAFSEWLRALGRPAVIAHRGASRAAPENSLAALRLSRELGADGAEFDVQRCASGELVVFHDRSLGRCTGALGDVRETPFDRLRALTLDRIDERVTGQRRGERIPTLDEWLDAAPHGLFLNLEVKADVLADTAFARECAGALRASGRTGAAVLSAFHPAALVHAALARQGVERGTLVEASAGWPARLAAGLATRPVAVHPQHVLVTTARVESWHRLGLAVAVWTVDAADEISRCLDAGVDAVITNTPDVARPIAERYRR